MKVTVVKPPKGGDLKGVEAEVLVAAFAKDGKIPGGVDELTDGALGRFLAKNKKFGKLFEAASFFISPKKHKSIEKVVLAGIGKADKIDTYRLRNFFGSVGKNHVKGAESAVIVLPKGLDVSKNLEWGVVGFWLGTFDSGHHKTKKKEDEEKKLKTVTIWAEGPFDLREIEKAVLISETLEKVREVVNLPANIVTPEYMVRMGKQIAAENHLKIEVFSEKQVNEMGMRIMASVARGSEEDLYFVVMRYLGGGSSGKTLALIGKGITFDSGGISIKPSEAMEWMKMDMAGAAAVFGAMEIIAKIKPKVNVVAAVPLTENLPSGKASKPGDVVKGLSGKTVEIINTDAEGRLVLADAITYVQKNFKPDYIVDAATLTGASVVALGTLATAILGRPQKFVDLVSEAAEETGERVWQLPLYEEYREQLKSYIADIANVSSSRGGGTQTGAKFLEEFVGPKTNWAHLDIAPNAWEENEKPYAAKGATGVAVTTMVRLAEKLGR